VNLSKFTSPKASALKLCVTDVSVLNQHVLPIEGGGAKACKPAIDAFHSWQRDAKHANVNLFG
jgi:hypothetical protein